jgi:hypothetical protein
MKRIYIILLIIIVVTIGLATFIKYLIIGKKLEISFITIQKHIPKDLAYNGCLNYYEWIIIKGEIQKENLEEEGYVIPDIDFSKNYLIISRYKILKLYQKTGINKSLGVPDGRVVFDKENSDKDYYYFYLMPKIMLSQGVG